ncbi:MAG: DNA mismatch repair protein MutL, partial [Eubacteriales bacterium]|nr:DNA mismatch repair protein MutL [Eubacteriales bacterium]
AGQNTERTENAAEQNIERSEIETADKTDTSLQETQLPNPAEMTQLSFLKEDAVLAEQSRTMFRIIGQVFDTYVMVEYKEALYIIDQHAAHEKVNYERMMKNFREKKVLSQNLFPAIILDLSTREAELVQKHLSIFAGLGYEIEHFGGKTWKVSAVPTNLYSVASRRLLIEIIDQLDELGELSPAVITQKLASMSCKAAVKGNNQLSRVEMEALIAELLTLDDPYHCPHGRPTIVSMSHYELDKKFKRIL